MAIVIEGMTSCSICGQLIEAEADIVMSPHFIWDEDHPLWRYSDSGMHRSCFLSWDFADQFRSAYNEIWPKIMPQHPREMLADGTIMDIS